MIVVKSVGRSVLEEADEEGCIVDEAWEEGFEEVWRTVGWSGKGAGDSETTTEAGANAKEREREVRRVEKEKGRTRSEGGKYGPHSIRVEHILEDNESKVEVSSKNAGSEAERVGLTVGSETCWEGVAEGVENWVGEGDGWVVAEGEEDIKDD